MGLSVFEVCLAVLQAEALKLNKPLVVVGTPGRLAELSRLGTLQSHNTTILVLDEVIHPNIHLHLSISNHRDVHYVVKLVNTFCWSGYLTDMKWLCSPLAMAHDIHAQALCVLHLGTCMQVDQLLAVQFREDMVRLIDHVGRKAPRRQTLLVSATLNEKVLHTIVSPSSDSSLAHMLLIACDVQPKALFLVHSQQLQGITSQNPLIYCAVTLLMPGA